MINVFLIDDKFKKKLFNSVSQHPLQSWEWGDARKEMGIDVERFGQSEDDKLQEVFQVTFHKIPYTPFTIGYLPRSGVPSKQGIDYLRELGRSKRAIFIKIEPNVEKTQESVSNMQKLSLTKSPHPLFPQWTQILDLTPDIEELSKNLKQKTRYNVRLAERNGVKVKEMTTNEGYKLFENLYFKTTKRQKYHGHSKQYHRVIFNNLKKDISHILIAFYKGKPLASYHLFLFNNILYYPYGGSSEEHKNFMASNLIMWEAVKLGKQYNAMKFDMWGSLPPDYDRKSDWSGFTKFKEGYGTKFVEFIGSYDLIINPIWYSMYGLANKVRQVLLQF